MNSVIISDYGVTLGKTGERLVVRGARPRLELIEGGPQLVLPLGLNHKRPTLAVIASDGPKTPAPPLRRMADGAGATSPKKSPDQVEIPLFRVGEIVIGSPGVSLSADLVEACCERGIRLSFLTRSGKPYAMLCSPMLTATVITRREQIAAYNDQRGVTFAKAIVRGKLANQASLLKYFGKYLKESDPSHFDALNRSVISLGKNRSEAARVSYATVDQAREQLLAIEGRAGRTYWRGVRLLIPAHLGFESRDHRGAPDPVNSALNYGYGILYSQVWGAVMNAGLEPFAGFLHVDRPGKPSLVLDMVEEFRQPVVDRAVIASIGRGRALETRDGMLTENTRRMVASSVLERLESEVTFRGRRHQLRSVIQIQARNFASFLRGGDPYRAFSFKW